MSGNVTACCRCRLFINRSMDDAATLKRKWVEILFDFVVPACKNLCAGLVGRAI
jgi:hypothetical protein